MDENLSSRNKSSNQDLIGIICNGLERSPSPNHAKINFYCKTNLLKIVH